MTDEHEPNHASDMPSGCPIQWLAADVGAFLAGGEPASFEEAVLAGRQVLARGAREVEDLLGSSYAPHEVVATELRFAGPGRGFRRTVFALTPSPAALLLLCLRLCDGGDDVHVLQHTAAHGTITRAEQWPFGMADAERLTRPPERDTVPLPEGLHAEG